MNVCIACHALRCYLGADGEFACLQAGAYLGLDCPAVQEYRRRFGDRVAAYQTEIYPCLADLLFPRAAVAEQPSLFPEPQPTYQEGLAAAHDRLAATYAQRQAEEEAKKEQYSHLPVWLRRQR